MAFANYHTLNMIYPALYLLPPGSDPFFFPPKDHTYREKPKLGAYHLTPDNLSFFHRSAVTGHSQLDDNSSDSKDLSSTVNAITMAAGTTNLEIASFDRGYGNVSHRFCLNTIWKVTNGGGKYRQFCFTLSAHELDTLLDSGASDGVFAWIELLSNLLHRESDRAYLHVQQQLMASNVALACREEALYADQWDTEVATDVGELMAVRIRCQTPNGSWVPLSNCSLKHEIKAAKDHAFHQYHFVLPCGHSAMLTHQRISGMLTGSFLDQECNVCGHKILDTSGRIDAERQRKREARGKWAEEEEKHVFGLDDVVELSRLSCALGDALNHVKTPSSATPCALDFRDCPETQAVLEAIEDHIDDESKTLSAHDLLTELERLSTSTLVSFAMRRSETLEELPPGLLVFIGRWLSGTVKFMSARRTPRIWFHVWVISWKMCRCPDMTENATCCVSIRDTGREMEGESALCCSDPKMVQL